MSRVNSFINYLSVPSNKSRPSCFHPHSFVELPFAPVHINIHWQELLSCTRNLLLSGLRLSLIGQALSKRLTGLQIKYSFSKLVIVAHSMGGLVSRDIINNLVELDSPIQVPLFITLSTPWGGHEAAQMGVKYAPAVISSWLDMVPNSPFIGELWESPLPDETAYVLLFGYSGRHSAFIGQNNDGTVTLSSQLPLKAQENAITIRGFNANHTGILSDPQTLEYFHSLMDKWPF